MLRAITSYEEFNGTENEHISALYFWKILEGFNQEQLASYLRYVWGRSRLTHSFSDSHKILLIKGKPIIPLAHTCFFQVDIGENYTSEEDLRKKLLYGMENCTIILEEGRNLNLAADFGMTA